MQTNETKTVTLLKSEYDEMERICKEKKDAEIVVKFYLYQNNGFGRSVSSDLLWSKSKLSKYDSDRIKDERWETIEDTIKKNADAIRETIIKDYNELAKELQASRERFSAIQNKWWFRLFNNKKK